LLSGTLNGFYSKETIAGHLDGDAISFTANRPDGVQYSLSNAPLDSKTVTLATSNPVAPWDLEFKVDATKSTVELQEPRRLRQPGGQQG
jgi:hypothetical protein